jgi:hypothetical protein
MSASRMPTFLPSAQPQRQIDGGGGLADAALAAGDGDDGADARHAALAALPAAGARGALGAAGAGVGPGGAAGLFHAAALALGGERDGGPDTPSMFAHGALGRRPQRFEFARALGRDGDGEEDLASRR